MGFMLDEIEVDIRLPDGFGALVGRVRSLDAHGRVLEELPERVEIATVQSIGVGVDLFFDLKSRFGAVAIRETGRAAADREDDRERQSGRRASPDPSRRLAFEGSCDHWIREPFDEAGGSITILGGSHHVATAPRALPFSCAPSFPLRGALR